MKIAFMGTPTFAIPSLEALIKSEHSVIAVVSQPDKPKGRGRKIIDTPTKSVAINHDIPVLQPNRIKTEEFLRQLEDLAPDLICVVAYGKILPKEILTLPRYGCINVHASILPKYRGAAPINWAIINGEVVTGITTMLMDEGMDTGDILLKKEIAIESNDNSETLSKKLSLIGADLILDTLDKYINKEIKPIKQNDNEATYAPMLKKESGDINWKKGSNEIRNQIRGTLPWPGSFTFIKGKMLKIYDSEVSSGKGNPGEIIMSDPKALRVATNDGSIDILELQIEGGKKLRVEEFLRGRSLKAGTILGQ